MPYIKIRKNKKFLFGILMLFVFAVSLLGIFFLKGKALAVPPETISEIQGSTINDYSNIIEQNSVPVESKGEAARDKAEAKERKWVRNLKAAGAAAFKQSLKYFLNTLAYDTATWIASGGQGQSAMFQQLGWEEYMRRLGDNTAGHFIEGFSKNFGNQEKKEGGLFDVTFLGLKSFCAPQFNIKLRLTLGLRQTARPREATCKWSQIQNNWTNFIEDPNFLNRFKPSFSPYENELGVTLGVYTNFFDVVTGKPDILKKDREEGQGIIPVKDFVSDNIKTPAKFVDRIFGKVIDTSTDKEKSFTGELVADALDVFVNTLAAKLTNTLMEKGLALLSGTETPKKYNWERLEGIISREASPATGSRKEAQAKFASFLTTNFKAGDPRANRIDVTSHLLNSEIINVSFKTAIDNKMTIGEAISAGLLRAEGAGSIFGWKSAEVQPEAHEGYSYDSMVILRKYRILPVGWEIAATYIKENAQKKIYSLNDIIKEFEKPDSPFYRLINPNWVLKAPETYCRLAGSGDQLSSDSWNIQTVTNNLDVPPTTYTFNRHEITRDTYCADSRSCIFEDESGNCIYYGYCTAERPIWRFDGTACPAYYNSCESFSDSQGKKMALLSDTLDSNNCNLDSVGCGWYCSEYNPYSRVWTCLSEEERVLKKCENLGLCSVSGTPCGDDRDCNAPELCQGAGCEVIDPNSGRSCTIPVGQVACTISSCGPESNQVLNSGFENQATGTVLGEIAQGWTTLDEIPDEINRVSGLRQHVNSGSYSLRIYYPGGQKTTLEATSDLITINVTGDATYVLSADVYNTLIYGQTFIEILDAAGVPIPPPNGCKTNTDIAKGIWETVSCEFIVPSGVNQIQVRVAVENWNDVNGDGIRDAGEILVPVGTAWFDNLNVQPSCPTQDIKLTLEGSDSLNQSKLFFDRDVKECQFEERGCSQFISNKPNKGTNLIDNGSFEIWTTADDQAPDGWFKENLVQTQVRKLTDGIIGQNYIEVVSNTDSQPDLYTGPIPALVFGNYYILSFYAKSTVDNTDWTIDLLSSDDPIADYATVQDITINGNPQIDLKTSWQRYISDPIRFNIPGETFHIVFSLPVNFIVNPLHLDGIQLEAVSEENLAFSDYKDYNSVNSVYLRKAPDWLECRGDPETDHSQCSQYALYCQENEIGCKLYTPTNNDPPVPGIITRYDTCPKECLNYQTYKQSETNFEPERFPVYFIADTATECSSVVAGCQEFTNLDKVAKGGEAREYYTSIRQCRKLESSKEQCKTFYTWSGSDETGYQIQAHNLLDYSAGVSNNEPDMIPVLKDFGTCEVTTADLNGPCQAAGHLWINGRCINDDASLENVKNNPYCREFISGDDPNIKSYINYPNTISCSDDCHPLRMIGTTQGECEARGAFWGSCADGGGNPPDPCPGALVGNVCYTLEADCGGGNTFTELNGCVYLAIPSQGQTCSKGESGCREYKGNAGTNVRTVFFDDFEDGDVVGFRQGTISNEAIAVGGHSLLSTDPNRSAQTFFITTTDIAPNNYSQACSEANFPECDAQASNAPCHNKSLQTCTFILDTQKCTANYDQFGCSVLNDVIQDNSAYLLSFWAKSSGVPVQKLNVELATNDPDGDLGKVTYLPVDIDNNAVNGIRITSEWQLYNLGPFLVGASAPDYRIVFTVDAITPGNPTGQANIDFITIRKVNEYKYLIKDSWKTPISCDTNPYLDLSRFVPPNAPQYMLGCQEYVSSDGQVLNLKSFDRLCRENAVGCESFIDTQNTLSPYETEYNTGSQAADILIPEDKAVYLVHDPFKECTPAAKGCQLVGRPTLNPDTGLVQAYNTIALLNDPETYTASLCTEKSLGCQEFVSESQGLVYFKDPKERTCEYRSVPNSDQFGWFKTQTNAQVPDCPEQNFVLGNIGPGKSCVGGDRPSGSCVKDDDCTGGGSCVSWAGVCSNNMASCNAYVDPSSSNEPSVLPNSNFEGYDTVCTNGTTLTGFCSENDDCDTTIGETCNGKKATFWTYTNDTTLITYDMEIGFNLSSALILLDRNNSIISQQRKLDGGTLYTISALCKAVRGGPACDASFELTTSETSQRQIFMNFDNSVVVSPDQQTIRLALSNNQADPDGNPVFKQIAGRFFVTETDGQVKIKVIGTGVFDSIELKKTGVYHYLDKDLDKTSCNGIVDPAKGCVLFNDASITLLQFDSLATVPGQVAKICESTGCDANTLLKVRPDRVCSEWLDCITSRQQQNFQSGLTDSYCQQIVACDRINPNNGKCSNYPQIELRELEFDRSSVNLLSNLTGYSKVGFKWGEETSVAGYYHYGVMPQKKICVEPISKFGEACIEDEECNSSVEKNDGVCQPVLSVRQEKDVYESCRIYPESTSPRWGATGPVDTGDNPAKISDPLVDVENPLGNFETRTPSQLQETSECLYTRSENIYQGLYGYCVEKDPRSNYLCMNWLPVDELTGGWIGVAGWVDNIRDQVYFCTEGAALETRYPGKFQKNKCYKSDAWEVILGFMIGGLLITLGIVLLIVFPPVGVALIGVGVLSTAGGQGAYYLMGEDDTCGGVVCPVGYRPQVTDSDCSTFFQHGTRCRWWCIPDESDLFMTDVSTGLKWYDYRDRVTKDAVVTKKHIMYCPECPKEGLVMWDPEKDTDSEGRPLEWKRACTRVAKVSENDGANKGWMERLEAVPDFENANYRVKFQQPYDFELDTINRPFGAIHSRYRGDPASWSLIGDRIDPTQAANPLYPAYLEGLIGNDSHVGQYYYDKYYRPDEMGTIDPNDTLPVVSWGKGVERIKRLFAKNYGYYYWDGSKYVSYVPSGSYCEAGFRDGETCSGDPECTDTTSTCEASPGTCSYLTGQDTPADPSDDKWYDSDELSCPGPIGRLAFCDTALDCKYGNCFNDNNNEEDDSNEPCNQNSECTKQGEVCSAAGAPKYGRCNVYKAGAPQIPCLENKDCIEFGGTICENKNTYGYCTGGKKEGWYCANAGQCRIAGQEGYCSGACVGGAEGPSQKEGGFCRDTAFCQQSGRCVAFGSWVPPSNQCPNNARPNAFTDDDTDPLWPGDWCGVSPKVILPKIENAPANFFDISGGSGDATLLFNVEVDNNQLPLVLIEIDWGDGSEILTHAPRIGMRDRRDIRDPLRFTHKYEYNKSNPQCINDATADESKGEVEDGALDCRFMARVRVKDNWGWCSNDQFAGDAKCNNASWAKVPNLIRVTQ